MAQLKELKIEIERLNNIIELLEYEIENLKNRKLGRNAYDNEIVIKIMYDMYLNNESFKNIADFLNNNNIKTKTNKLWAKSSVSSILKNNKNLKKYLTETEYIIFNEQLKKKKKINNIQN